MENDTYYQKNAEKILAEMEPFFKGIEQAAAQPFGTAFAASAVGAAWQRFKLLLPGLPYIGGDENSFPTENLVFGAAMLCLYQEMKAGGKSVQETGKLVYDAFLAGAPALQEDVHQAAARISATHRQSEAFSTTHPYPFGWQTKFVEGDSQNFDWGVDYTSCGICTLFQQHGAQEFLPYLCFLDLPSYRARGIGLVRASTLGLGAERCAFRFNLRAEYSMEWYPDFYVQ
jgi:hypothetical protein